MEVAEDCVVDRELAVEHLLQIGLDVAQTEVQALQRLELVGDAGGKRADRYVTDVTQQVLDADFFRLLGLDDRRCVDEGL